MKVNSDRGGRHLRLTRSETKARTRQHLLESAARVFAAKGFAGASVEEIAESAGYSIGALYSNFDGKEHLFLELSTAKAAARVVAVGEILNSSGRDKGEVLEALKRLLVEVADYEVEDVALQTEFWLYALRNPKTISALSAHFGEPLEGVERLVAAGLEGSRADPDRCAADVTTVIVALFQGLVRQRRLEPTRVPDELFGQALEWLFNGIGAPADSGHSNRRGVSPISGRTDKVDAELAEVDDRR